MKTKLTKKELMTKVMRTAWTKFKSNEKEIFAECLKSAWKVVKNELNFEVYKKYLLKNGYTIWNKMNGEIEMSRIYVNDFYKYIDNSLFEKYTDVQKFRKQTRKFVENFKNGDLFNYDIKVYFDLISKQFKTAFYKSEYDSKVAIIEEFTQNAVDNIRQLALNF